MNFQSLTSVKVADCRAQPGSISAVWTHFTGAGYIYPPGIHLPDERVSVFGPKGGNVAEAETM